MNPQTIQQVVDEVGPQIEGHYFGKVFQLSAASFAFDLGLRNSRYFFISVEPAAPSIHIIKRRLKDLERAAIPNSTFAQALRARLNGASVLTIQKDLSDRVIRLALRHRDELGNQETRVLVVQLTGRSANLLLLDQGGRIINAVRATTVAGQRVGDVYEVPNMPARELTNDAPLQQGTFASLSDALDHYYQTEERKKAFHQRANNLLGRVRKEIRQRSKLKENLERDLVSHGDPEQHKRRGDLLLANISTAIRKGPIVVLKDFYSEGSPEIELEADENTSLQEEAARYFARYSKAKRAIEEIGSRLRRISVETDELLRKQRRLEEIISEHDEEALGTFEKPSIEPTDKAKQPRRPKVPGARLYKSSDGFEILVGRAARDNDELTFRVAKANDLWLHTADYAGSHVIVRGQNRKEVPHRTIVEAAQLAARFSQARKDSKVVVHYTQRKFLSKPKGAAPGLVRMSNYKSIVVEPKESVPRVTSDR